jgi:hypothetical protein
VPTVPEAPLPGSLWHLASTRGRIRDVHARFEMRLTNGIIADQRVTTGTFLGLEKNIMKGERTSDRSQKC